MQSDSVALAVLSSIALGFATYGLYLAQKAKASDRRIERYEALLAAERLKARVSAAE